MDRLLEFKVFCLESYKNEKSISGQEAFALFDKYNVFDYISRHYSVLHSTGRLYMVSDIESFIADKKN